MIQTLLFSIIFKKNSPKTINRSFRIVFQWKTKAKKYRLTVFSDSQDEASIDISDCDNKTNRDW